MSRYRRNYVPGGTYFFTLVTQDRQPILTDATARRALRKAFRNVRRKRPFGLVAIAVLPDHLHAVLTLPSGDSDYSLRWAQIKEGFTREYLTAGGIEATRMRPNAERPRAVCCARPPHVRRATRKPPLTPVGLAALDPPYVLGHLRYLWETRNHERTEDQ